MSLNDDVGVEKWVLWWKCIFWNNNNDACDVTGDDDEDASHQVDIDEDKSLSNLDEGGGGDSPLYRSSQ